jgi:hypothetical protein
MIACALFDPVHLATCLSASDGLGQQRRLTAGHPVSDGRFVQQESAEQQRYDDQPNEQLLLVDLVSFDHCQEVWTTC